MRFLNSFSAQHDRLFIGLVMSTEIFEFRPYLCLWRLFKEGTRQAVFTNSECLYSQILNEAIFGHSLEKKSGLELNFTPENTPHMSRLHIGNSREGKKRFKNEQF